MEEPTLCLVWCEACCNRHWDVMNRLAEAGRAVSKSGTLKLALRCGMCWRELAAGDDATAFTVDSGPDRASWEADYLDLDSDECGCDG